MAKPYLDTRSNDIHTEISIRMAYRLLEMEDGDMEVVIPAITLHDVGYKSIPEELQRQAFGVKTRSPELRRVHEKEGARIAKEILETLNYDKCKTKEILEIIDGHDSRKEAISFNDKIVKDADKLFRYSKMGHQIMSKIAYEDFGESPLDRLNRLQKQIDGMFFTSAAKEIAREELRDRFLESEDNDH